MRRTVSLSEFMPYGAPDLLAAAPERMTRAVLTSTLLAMTAFLLLWIVVPHWPHTAPPAVVIRQWVDLTPPRSITAPIPPPRATVPVAPARTSDAGVPRPVPEVNDPPPSTPASGEAGGAAHGVDDLVVPPVGPVAPPGEPPPPEPTWFADELPVAIAKPEPLYPEIARDAGVEGLVLVQALVGKDGRVTKAMVPSRYSIPLLDEAAIEAAQRWVFKPALTNGRPVPVWVALRFRFSLH